MALSTTEVTIDAGSVGQVAFDLSFEGGIDNPPGYIEKAHIFLWINDIQLTEGGGATEYDGSGVTFSWITSTRVQIAGYSPVLDDKIEFRRTMPTNKPVVDFVDQGGVSELALDNSNLANLYAVHEIKDGFGTGTQNFYALAKLYATAPEDFEVETGTYSAYHWSLKAAASSTGIDDVLVDCQTAQTAAELAETNAETAQAAAETAETNAETAETNAEAAEAKAEKWASEAEDVEVETGKYSSYHWAQKAEDIAGSSHNHDDRYYTETEADARFVRPDVADSFTAAQAYTKTTKSGTSVTVDASDENYSELTLGGNTTINALANKSDGRCGFLRVIQAAGGYTLSFNAEWEFTDAAVPEIGTTAGDELCISWFVVGTSVRASVFYAEEA